MNVEQTCNKHGRPHRRGVALARLFAIAAMLQQSDHSLSVQHLHNEINRIMCETYCLRTVRRDVELMIEMGCVDLIAMEPMRVRWCGFAPITDGVMVLE